MSEQVRDSMVIEWSDDDQAYVVSLREWGDLVHTHGVTYEQALHEGKEPSTERHVLRCTPEGGVWPKKPERSQFACRRHI